jgi:hypothetical protein
LAGDPQERCVSHDDHAHAALAALF